MSGAGPRPRHESGTTIAAMSQPPTRPPATARPGNPELRRPFFEAAADILATRGYGDLKLGAVCAAVGVTTGAFYHSFVGWADFTAQFLEHWRVERTTRLAEQASAQASPAEALRSLVASADILQHRTEAAIRVWAAMDPAVAAVQRQVDEERLAAVRAAMSGLVGEADADHWTAWGVAVLAGHQMLGDLLTPEQLAWSLGRILAAAEAADPG